jgi:hypothetical protein
MIRTARTLSAALALLAGTAATAACVAQTAAQPAQPDAPFTLASLGHGISAAIDNPAAKAARSGSNAGFFIGPNACSFGRYLGSGAHLVILPNWCFRA